jgi:hypothetical protein
MTVFKIKNYPLGFKKFRLIQEASMGYLGWMLLIVAMYLMVTIAKHQIETLTLLVMVFLAVLISTTLGILKMKRTVVEIVFERDFFHIITEYHLGFGGDVEYFPVALSSNMKIFKKELFFQFSYKDQFYSIKTIDWLDYQYIIWLFEQGGEPVVEDTNTNSTY